MDKDLFLKKMGKNIAKVRKSKGFSQDKLYLEAGLARKTIHSIETGQVDPRLTTLVKIAKTLKVPLSELIGIK